MKGTTGVRKRPTPHGEGYISRETTVVNRIAASSFTDDDESCYLSFAGCEAHAESVLMPCLSSTSNMSKVET